MAAAAMAQPHAKGAASARRDDAVERTSSVSTIVPTGRSYGSVVVGFVRCEPCRVLQVQAVSVEVGGRLVVDDASFTIMPRDKVGLVGRNGAGKTSFFKVLGGETEQTLGKIVRKGGFGYLPQDPKLASMADGRTAITHVLSGRGIDDQLMR